MNMQSVMNIQPGGVFAEKVRSLVSCSAQVVGGKNLAAVYPKITGAVTPAFSGLSGFAAAHPTFITSVIVIYTAVTFISSLRDVVEMVKALVKVLRKKFWKPKKSEPLKRDVSYLRSMYDSVWSPKKTRLIEPEVGPVAKLKRHQSFPGNKPETESKVKETT